MELDPFKVFPQDISDHILKYLNGTDILEASLVSKYWYQFFGASTICMKKLKISYGVFDEKKDLTPIFESDRRYQYFVFSLCHVELKSNGRIMRNVRSIINKFSNSAVKIRSSQDIQRIFELPNLKELILNCTFIYHYRGDLQFIKMNGLISKAKNLEILDVNGNSMSWRWLRYFKQNLQYLENLKTLKTDSVALLDGIHSSDYKFQLEEFHFTIADIHDNLEISIAMRFMRQHSASLKVIKFSEPPYEAMEIILPNFPFLHTLIINKLPEYYDKYILEDYPVNNNIKTLQIETEYDDYDFIANFNNNIIKLLSALPNLETIEFNCITIILARVISTMGSVKVVRYHYIDDDDDEDELESLATEHPQINFLQI